MKFFGIEIKRDVEDAVEFSLTDKLITIEAVAGSANSIIYIEPILRVKLMMKFGMIKEEEGDVLEVYNKHELDNIKKIYKLVSKKEYENILRLTEERYKELRMTIDMDTLEYLQKAVGENGTKKSK